MKNSYLRRQKMKNRSELPNALSIAGAAGTTRAWNNPVVNALVLPVHADTTQTTCTLYSVEKEYENTESFNLQPQEFDEPTLAEKILDSVIPVANASHNIGQADKLTVCACITGDTYTLSVHRFVNEDNFGNCEGEMNVLYSGSGTLSVESGPLTVVKSCNAQSGEESPLAPVTALLDNLVPDVSVRVALKSDPKEDCGLPEDCTAVLTATLNTGECPVDDFAACPDCFDG